MSKPKLMKISREDAYLNRINRLLALAEITDKLHRADEETLSKVLNLLEGRDRYFVTKSRKKRIK
jgi:hypothetical protein